MKKLIGILSVAILVVSISFSNAISKETNAIGNESNISSLMAIQSANAEDSGSCDFNYCTGGQRVCCVNGTITHP